MCSHSRPRCRLDNSREKEDEEKKSRVRWWAFSFPLLKKILLYFSIILLLNFFLFLFDSPSPFECINETEFREFCFNRFVKWSMTANTRSWCHFLSLYAYADVFFAGATSDILVEIHVDSTSRMSHDHWRWWPVVISFSFWPATADDSIITRFLAIDRRHRWTRQIRIEKRETLLHTCNSRQLVRFQQKIWISFNWIFFLE